MKRERKKKVLMLASVASMIDQFNMANIRLLLDMGYEVHVACNFRKGNTCSKVRIQKLQETLDQWRVVWHQWDCPRSICPVSKCVAAYRQLQILIRVYRFAWIHCHSPIGGALARVAAHQRGIGVIYTAHGFHFFRGAPVWNWLLYYPAERLLSRWCDVLIAINKEDYLLAKNRMYAKRLFYLPGVGIDTVRFQRSSSVAECRECRRKYNVPQNAMLLLSVGELSRRKNHKAVLEALAGTGRQEYCYLICGQGELKSVLQKRAKELGIADKVRMLGFLEDPAKLYHAAGLFIFRPGRKGFRQLLWKQWLRACRVLLQIFGETGNCSGQTGISTMRAQKSRCLYSRAAFCMRRTAGSSSYVHWNICWNIRSTGIAVQHTTASASRAMIYMWYSSG